MNFKLECDNHNKPTNTVKYAKFRFGGTAKLSDATEFSLAELKTGMIVELRNGKKYIVMRDVPFDTPNILKRFDGYGFLDLDDYDDNGDMCRGTMTEEERRSFDIMKVFCPLSRVNMLNSYDYKRIWRRIV